MEVLVNWFIIPLLILLVTGPVATIIYVALIKQNRLNWLIVYYLGLVLAAVAVGVFIAQKFGSFFPDVGFFTALLTPVVAVVTLFVFRWRAKRLEKSSGTSGLQDRWLLIGIILIPVLQLSSPVIGNRYAQTCDNMDKNAASPIIAALQAYQTDTGNYPSDLKMLIPRYIASIAPSACMIPFLNYVDTNNPVRGVWNLYYCANNKTHEIYLTIPKVGSDSLQIYNLKTQDWFVGNNFDGFCGP